MIIKKQNLSRIEVDELLNHLDTCEGAFLIFDECTFDGINFMHYHFRNTMFDNCTIENCVFNCAYLYNLRFCCTKFTRCMFDGATLRLIDFSYTNEFDHCKFECALLSGCDFDGATIKNTSFDSARLDECNFRDSTICDKTNSIYVPKRCPEGEFIAWKKAYVRAYNPDGICATGRPVIVKLLIPADAKRVSGTTSKCRCDKAKVLDIIDEYYSCTSICHSGYDSTFAYTIGETVTVDDFDDDWTNTCSKGIHFFIDRKEAEDY